MPSYKEYMQQQQQQALIDLYASQRRTGKSDYAARKATRRSAEIQGCIALYEAISDRFYE